MRGLILGNARRMMAGSAVAVACAGGLAGLPGFAGQQPAGAAATATVPGMAAAPGPVAQVTRQVRFVRCGAGALADAIRAGGRLVLSRGCVYLLTQPLPVLHGKLHIEGNKATIRRSRAAGTPGFSLLKVAPNGVVTIRDAILRNGRSPHHGGAIDNAGGQLTVINVVFKHNTARQGGAIWNGGRALLRRDTFLRNHAQAGGGLFSAGPAQLESAFFTANTAAGRGGAIRAVGHLAAKFVTFRRNHAAAGGAVYAGGLLTLDSSIFLSNRAAGAVGLAANGGGLYAVARHVRTTGLTLRNNWSRGAGGAVYLAAAVRSALFQRAVIFGNRSGSGGGIENSGGSTGTVHLASSTISQNTPSNCAPAGSVPGCSG